MTNTRWSIVTEHRDFHRLPTGAWASEGPAPVDRTWKSLRARHGAEPRPDPPTARRTRNSGHHAKTPSYTT